MGGDKEFFESNPVLCDVLNGVTPDAELLQYDEVQSLIRKSKEGFLTWDEMMKLPHEENSYLIDRFLWEGQVAMILAKEKVGKSILSKQMICSLTSGEPLFDEYDVSRPCNVCYIQLEGDRGETKSRFKSMAEGLKVGKDRFYWRFFDRLSLDKDEDANKLISELYGLDKSPDVVFIDPVYMACSGSLSSDDVVRRMIGNIRRIQETFNCAVLLVHHEHRQSKDQNGKYIDEGDNAIMGSFAFKAFVSHVIRVTKKADGTRILKCDTQRNGGVESEVRLTLQEDPLMYKKQVAKIPSGMTDTVLEYIKAHKEGVSSIEFVNKHKSCRTTVDRAFVALRKSGLIKKYKIRGKHEVVYVATGRDK
jgi:RecA-family ATPase